MGELIAGPGFEIVPVTEAAARRVANIYGRWGKGVTPTALNFGDRFAYYVVAVNDCPLLHVGDDFSRTDPRAVP
jgi:ribonuclease VapC